MSRPIIFLEFDNVLVVQPEPNRRAVEQAIAQDAIAELPALWRQLFREEARANLRTLHLEFNPTYVITSPWTGFLSLEDAKAVLRLGRLGFVADHVDANWYTYLGEASFRLAELELWLLLHGDTRPYLVLDDARRASSLDGTAYEENLVICTPQRGFDIAALQAARSILRTQYGAVD